MPGVLPDLVEEYGFGFAPAEPGLLTFAAQELAPAATETDGGDATLTAIAADAAYAGETLAMRDVELAEMAGGAEEIGIETDPDFPDAAERVWAEGERRADDAQATIEQNFLGPPPGSDVGLGLDEFPGEIRDAEGGVAMPVQPPSTTVLVVGPEGLISVSRDMNVCWFLGPAMPDPVEVWVRQNQDAAVLFAAGHFGCQLAPWANNPGNTYTFILRAAGAQQDVVTVDMQPPAVGPAGLSVSGAWRPPVVVVGGVATLVTPVAPAAPPAIAPPGAPPTILGLPVLTTAQPAAAPLPLPVDRGPHTQAYLDAEAAWGRGRVQVLEGIEGKESGAPGRRVYNYDYFVGVAPVAGLIAEAPLSPQEIQAWLSGAWQRYIHGLGVSW